MIKYIVSVVAPVVLVFAACHKTLSTGDATFGVSISSQMLSAGDTARFTFSGNPDVITFYSGEPGNRYAYRNRDTANGTPLLRFRSLRANGTQANSLSVMVSDNFEGVLVNDTTATVSRIQAAAWTDITSRAILSSGGTTAVASGNIDLSDFSAVGKPVYIGFKFQGFAGSAQSKWTIDSFTVKNVLADGTTYTIANLNANNVAYANYGVSAFSPGFVAFRPVNKYYWVVSAGTSLVITGETAAAAAAPAEAWAIIGPVRLNKVSPDVGMVVKNVAQKTSGLKFSYIYKTPGVYNALFTGGRADAGGADYTIQSLPVTVK